MKTKGFIIGAFALALVLVGTGANAYKGLGVSNNSVLPSAADFNWVNNIGTLTWGSTSATEISIAVRVSAPDDDGTWFDDDSYDPYEPGTIYGSFSGENAVDYDSGGDGGTFTDTHSSANPTSWSTFDEAYGYFYDIALGGSYSGSLSSFGFNLGPATITEIGYDTGDSTVFGWGINEDNILSFVFLPALEADDTASVYVASNYWWGWSNAILGGSEQTAGGYNNTGQLPAPNPEAPTVALFMLGIFGLHVWRNKGLKFMANSQ